MILGLITPFLYTAKRIQVLPTKQRSEINKKRTLHKQHKQQRWYVASTFKHDFNEVQLQY